jgi:hypothetical protein
MVQIIIGAKAHKLGVIEMETWKKVYKRIEKYEDKNLKLGKDIDIPKHEKALSSLIKNILKTDDPLADKLVEYKFGWSVDSAHKVKVFVDLKNEMTNVFVNNCNLKLQ